jgi:hypothetical protein
VDDDEPNGRPSAGPDAATSQTTAAVAAMAGKAIRGEVVRDLIAART